MYMIVIYAMPGTLAFCPPLTSTTLKPQPHFKDFKVVKDTPILKCSKSLEF